MDWRDDLTDEQLNAVTQTGSHARLLAGPGTGKTLCLTRRVIRLLEDEKLAPAQILVLTFTRAARAELRSRILAAVTDEELVPYISTLHSYALRLLLRYPDAAPLPRPLRITDDWEDRWIIEEELRGVLGLPSIKDSRKLLAALSADWEQLKVDGADWETHFPNPAFLGAWREHRKVYGYTLRGELVYHLKHAIEAGELEGFVPPRCLVIDEYQDLNACDLAVIRSLASRGAELYCAGDDDQSIYGFRFASPDGIRRFTTEYKPSSNLELGECKRCDRRILEYALFVAQQDPRRISKRLECSPGAGSGEVHALRFSSQANEAEGVATICEHLIRNSGVKPGDILVLLRTDWHGSYSKILKSAFDARKVPAAVGVNPLAPLEQPEGRVFLSVMRLVDNPRDNLAWRSLLSGRENGIGFDTLFKVYELARGRGVSFLGALDIVHSNPTVIGSKGSALVREIDSIKALLTRATKALTPDLLDFSNQLANQFISDEADRKAVVALVERAIELSSASELPELLRAIQTSLGDAEAERDPEKISIMTMHQAKGLTADAVLVVAAEDENIPGRARGESLDDERRLLYVSLSRARHFLYVTYCSRRTGQQSYSGRSPGKRGRSLTQFLQDSPTKPEDGKQYLNSIR